MTSLGVLLGAAILRIAVGESGLYEVPPAPIKSAGLDLAACDLYGGATETAVPIIVQADGGFEFLAAARPRHSKRTVFVLRPRPEGSAAARAERPGPVPEGYFRVERNDVYDPVSTSDRAALAPFGYGSGPDFFYFAKPAAALELSLEFPKPALERGAGPIPVRLGLQGDRRAGASNGVDIVWNGTRLPKPIRWSGPAPHVAEVLLERRLLKDGPNAVRLEARDGRVRLDSVELGLSEAAPSKPRRPLSIERAAPEDLLAGGADWVAVTVDACAGALGPLAAHRERQGLKTRVVRLRDVFDTFSAGNFDPRAIRRFLEHAAAAWKPAPRYVLLVGDATFDVDWLGPEEGTLPAALVDTCENGASASDNWFVAFDVDRTLPSMAIGRFPVTTAAAAKGLVERTIASETRAPYGPWRRRLSFVAGEGRFGEAVDRAIEDLALRIFNDYIPQGYELNMTYASASSPYLYIPRKITDKVIERLNEGCAVLNYTGHGARDGLEDLSFRGKSYPIFESRDVPRVKCGERRPIVLITACWTGCFDYPAEESVGEILLEHERGPAAVFASSRVSHPYSNAVLSKELVAGLFGRGTAGKRIGDALVESKRLMMEAKDEYRDMIATYGLMFLGDPLLLIRLLKDDAHLFNLLGDPALLLPFPKGTVAIEALGPAAPGKKLKVRGTADTVRSGKAIVTFEVERKTIRGDLVPIDFEKPGAEKRIVKNYETANDKVVARAEVKVQGGAFEAELALPEDLLYSKHYVKAYAWSDESDALGALEVTVADGDE